MGPTERRAVLTLLGLGLAGQALRLATAPGGSGAGAVSLHGDSVAEAGAQRQAAERAGLPLALGERIDVDRAPARELVRVPGVGPALARAIVEDREAHGSFGGLEALGRVRGIGPRTLARLEPHLRFSAPAGAGPVPAGPGAALVDLNRADSGGLLRLPGVGPALAGRILALRRARGPFRTLDELLAVPGIGPKTLERLRGLVTPG